MQASSLADTPVTSGAQLISSVGLNGSHNNNQAAFALNAAAGNKFILEQVDPATLEDEDSDSDISDAQQQQLMVAQQTLQNVSTGVGGPKPGKKTKGRVKIKMEFIENKLRRYTTFSKRKTGIMKKAYELSTLTGTQVMLLVASETGHVYTFATRKLQPMITSESGKALIQTCLNSPDLPPVAPGQQQAVEQRMNPTGFEETELTYAVSEEESKALIAEGLSTPVFQVPNIQTLQEHPVYQTAQVTNAVSGSQSVQIATPTTSVPISSYIQSTTAAAAASTTSATTKGPTNISMQIPAGLLLQPGTPITIPIQQSGQRVTTGQTQQQTVYRIPTPNQVVSVSSVGGQQCATTESSQTTIQSATTGVSTPSYSLVTGSSSTSGTAAMTPGIVMYQTPQGVVYATPTATLQDRIFNFQQPATAISVPQQDQQTVSNGQQIIIPVPVSLAGSTQVLHLAPPDTGTIEVTQPPVKRSRK